MRAALITGATVLAIVTFLAGAPFAPSQKVPSADGNAEQASGGSGLIREAHAVTPPKPKPASVNGLKTAPSSVALGPPSQPRTRRVTVSRGDTLMKLLVKNDIDRSEAHAVVAALSPVYDLRRLKIGQTFVLTLAPESSPEPAKATDRTDDGGDLLGLSFRPSAAQDILVRREPDKGFQTEIIERQLERGDGYAAGKITSSLYAAAIANDLPVDVLMGLIRIFSFDVDFQREVQPGDGFAVLYDRYSDEFGETVRQGEITWASMTLSGKTLQYTLHTPRNGVPDYYDHRGKSVKKTLMRTPIDGAKLTSRYGKRRHPVLGYTKMHRGVDFAARKGVPIMAAGDGVIESIGRNGSYGNYIRIRHNSTYKTAYAHMSGYKRGLKRGSRVRQGKIIGYVGNTGRTTGPHLHYEVLMNGRQTNPMSVRLPAGDALKGKALKRFLAGWPAIEARVALARGGQEVASD